MSYRSYKGHFYTFNGKRQCMSAWAREYGMLHQTLRARLKVGWDIERALITPVPPRKDKQAASVRSIISPETKARMVKSHAALTEHLQRELRAFLDSFSAALSLQAEQAAKDLSFIYSRGVGENFEVGAGTGGGSTTRGSAEIEFSRAKAVKP